MGLFEIYCYSSDLCQFRSLCMADVDIYCSSDVDFNVSHDAMADVGHLLSCVTNILGGSNNASVSEVFGIFEAIVVELAAMALEAVNHKAIAVVVEKLGLELLTEEVWECLAEDVVIE